MSNKPSLSLKEIAQKANVSQALVSLILNGKGRASDKVRNKVMKLLEESGYRPKYARHPFYLILDLPEIEAAGKTQIVFEQLSGMQRVFNEADLELRIEFLETNSGKKMNHVTEQVDTILQNKPSGIIVSTDATFRDAACERFAKKNIPLVQMGYDTENSKYSAVVSDSFMSAFMATRHLIGKGHRQIGLLRWLAGQAGINSNKKMAGYQAALSDAGIALNPDLILSIEATQGEAGWKPATEIVSELYKLTEEPTALVVENSFIGLSLLYPTAGADGKIHSAPQTLDIVLCEDWPLHPVHDIITGKLFYPEMRTTLVSMDWAGIGKAAARMVIEQASNSSSHPQILRISPTLYMVQGNDRKIIE